MRLVVVGGTRSMGREIVRRLVANGHDVSVLHRRDQHDLGLEVQDLAQASAERRLFGLYAKPGFPVSPIHQMVKMGV